MSIFVIGHQRIILTGVLPIIKIRWSNDCFIFIMWILYLERWSLYWDGAPDHVEDKLQRLQWTPGLSPWRPFCLCDNPVVSPHRDIIAWWRHQMKTFSGYWPFVWGIHRSPMKSPHKGLWSFDIFFDLRLNKRLSKQWWSWWFDVLSCSLWRHCNDQPCCIKTQKETECTNLINRNTLIHKQLETHWCIPSNGYRCLGAGAPGH